MIIRREKEITVTGIQKVLFDTGEQDLGLHQPPRKGVRVFPQYKNPKSYYQYTVELSADGKNWTKVVDMSGNKTPATAKGNEFKFDSPRKARYIRVNMLFHNLSKKVELVEVEWF